MAGGMKMDQPQKQTSSRTILIIAVVCALIVAVGLAIGLGVGLSNRRKEVVYVTVPAAQPTTTPITTEGPTTTTEGVTTVPQPTFPPANDGEPWGHHRLPDTILPSQYTLKLHPNLTTEHFTGSIQMDVDVVKATKYVSFHAKSNLKIDSNDVTLQTNSGVTVDIMRQFRVPQFDYYVIETNENLVLGKYRISLLFESFLNSPQNFGLYKTRYTDDDEGEFEIISTQFAPSQARNVFPCFDEPWMKIVYSTTLVHDPDHLALSNMDVKETITRDDGLTETVFNPTTIKMSSYLACFFVGGNYDYIEDTSTGGTKLRIYAPKHHIAAGRADHALVVSKKMVDGFENLFDMKYHLPKLDQILIPNFLGAMENWGLITYREKYLLYDAKESTSYDKYIVSSIVGHEIVHQWFGNVVTMSWWNDLWLNEGFANFFENLGADMGNPEWSIKDLFINFNQATMTVDAFVQSLPVVRPEESITTIGESWGMFNQLTYNKGGAILRMMQYTLGDDLFFGALKKYLHDNELKAAITEDLYTSMQSYLDAQSSSLNIKEILDPWLKQGGYPVVKVTKTGNKYKLVQSQYVSDVHANFSQRPESEYNYKWPLQMDYVIGDTSYDGKWFKTSEMSLTIASDEAVKFNPGGHGFYRVNYDDETWMKLAQQLESNHLIYSSRDRSNLLDDAFKLAASKQLPYTRALDMSAYLYKEETYSVWRTFRQACDYMCSMLEASPITYTKFKKYYLNKVKPLMDRLGYNVSEGTFQDKVNRDAIFPLALKFGDLDATTAANQMFQEWIDDPNVYIHPEIRSEIFHHGLEHGNEENWNILFQRYQDEKMFALKDQMLYGLATTNNVKLISELLEACKNTSNIPDYHLFSTITRIASTKVGEVMAWDWYKNNWEYLIDRFGPYSQQLSSLGNDIVSHYHTDLQLWEVEHFYDTHPVSTHNEYRYLVLATISANIEWVKENLEPIDQWLEDHLK